MAQVENAGLFADVDKATVDQVPAEFRPSTNKWTGIAARSTVLRLRQDQAHRGPAAQVHAGPGQARVEGQVGRLAVRRRLPGDRLRPARAQGRSRHRGMAQGHEGELQGLQGQQHGHEGRQRRRGRRRPDLPLLLLRRPGQDRRELQERHAVLLQEPGPGRVRVRLRRRRAAVLEERGGGPGLPEVHHRQEGPGSPAEGHLLRVRHRLRRPGQREAGPARRNCRRPPSIRPSSTPQRSPS